MKFTAKNKFVTETGLDYDPGKKTWIKNLKIEVDLADDEISEGVGRSITPRAFRKMIGDKLVKLKDDYLKIGGERDEIKLMKFLSEQKCAVEFGKETLLRILAQKNAVGLRFTFCVNDVGEESVIVSGIEEIEEISTNGNVQNSTRRTTILNRDAYRKENLGNPKVAIPMDDEKGVGKSYADFVKDTGITMQELLDGDEEKIYDDFPDKVLLL